eukprot:Rhum_TRINITY_DN13202_c0_g1::Rhum_TRINITY_DN13202_c0_g1_i1::g.58023::m.58023
MLPCRLRLEKGSGKQMGKWGTEDSTEQVFGRHNVYRSLEGAATHLAFLMCVQVLLEHRYPEVNLVLFRPPSKVESIRPVVDARVRFVQRPGVFDLGLHCKVVLGPLPRAVFELEQHRCCKLRQHATPDAPLILRVAVDLLHERKIDDVVLRPVRLVRRGPDLHALQADAALELHVRTLDCGDDVVRVRHPVASFPPVLLPLPRHRLRRLPLATRCSPGGGRNLARDARDEGGWPRVVQAHHTHRKNVSAAVIEGVVHNVMCFVGKPRPLQDVHENQPVLPRAACVPHGNPGSHAEILTGAEGLHASLCGVPSTAADARQPFLGRRPVPPEQTAAFRRRHALPFFEEEKVGPASLVGGMFLDARVGVECVPRQRASCFLGVAEAFGHPVQLLHL